MRTPVLLALSLLATQAAATPLQLNHQGRLFDSTGTPLTGAHDLSLTLFDAPSGGATLWTENEAGVTFDSGFFSIDLGTSTPFDLDTVQHSAELWLELSIDGAPPLPARLPLQSVPYALVAARADVATSVSGGPVDATSLTVNGTSVVAEDGTITWDRITGAPQQLGDLACGSAGQVPQWSGSAWSCVDPNAHEHSADQITSGTLSLDVIPIGTSQNTVARGDHTHTALDLDLGPNALDNPLNHDRYTDAEARAAVGPHTPAYTDTMAIAAVGPHTPAYTDTMAIAAVEGEPTLALAGKLNVAGEVRSSDAISSQGNQVQRDILTWNTGANDAVPIHIKTNIKVHSNVMFRIAIEGYNYGVAAAINSDTVGYPYVNYTCTGSAQNNNYANGVSISHYCSSDGYVVVKLTAGSFYYVGFTMSAFTLNPTGNAFDVTGTVYQQTANL